MRKQFILDEETVALMQIIQTNENIKSESATVRFVIHEYAKKQSEEEKIKRVLAAYDEQCRGFTERLKWATQTAEQNTLIMLDVLNTILIKGSIKENVLIACDFVEHDLIQQSRRKIKDKIAHFKQAKDDRLRKKNKANR